MKRIVGVGMTVLLLVAAAGCRQQKAPDKGETEGIVLTISLPEAEWNGYTEELTKLYRQERPKVEDIRWNLVDRSMYEDLLGVNLVSQNLPDIISVGNQVPLTAWSEHLVPLDLEAEKEGISERIVSWGRVGESLYSLPVLIQGKGIFYNTGLLEENGIRRLPQTRSELLALCGTLQEAEVKPIMNYYKETLLTDTSYLFFLPAIAGGAREDWYALADFLDLTLEYGNRNALTTGVDTARDYFFIEKYAMLNNEGSWMVPAMRRSAPEMEEKTIIGSIPLYEEAERNRLPVEILSLSVTKSSEHQEEAKAFLLWLATSETARDYLERTMGCLTVSGMERGDDKALSPVAVQVKEAILTGQAVIDQSGSLPEELKSGIASVWAKYITGQLDRDAAAETACALWNYEKN